MEWSYNKRKISTNPRLSTRGARKEADSFIPCAVLTLQLYLPYAASTVKFLSPGFPSLDRNVNCIVDKEKGERGASLRIHTNPFSPGSNKTENRKKERERELPPAGH